MSSFTSTAILIVLFFCTSSIIYCIAPLHKDYEMKRTINKFAKWYMVVGNILLVIYIIALILKWIGV